MDPEEVSQPLPEGVAGAAATVGASDDRRVGASLGPPAEVARFRSPRACPQAGQNLDPSATIAWQRGHVIFQPPSLPAFRPSSLVVVFRFCIPRERRPN